jgi:hypothetical protein
MKPHIICHMVASVDDKIDGSALSSVMVGGIDGRHEIPAVFDGVSPSSKKAIPLRLKSLERRKRDALWLRYEVVRSKRSRNRIA